MRRGLVLALSLAALVLSASPGMAQPAACAVALPVPNYRCDLIDNTFTSIVGAPGAVDPVLLDNDDAITAAIPFPAGFSYSHFGVAKTQVLICTNGWLTFALPAAASTSASNRHPGDGADPSDLVIPWWDDLVLEYPSSALTYLFDVPGQTLTVQWTDVANFSNTANVGQFTFQCILFGSAHPTQPNAIEFHYDRVTAPPVMAPCDAANPSTYATSATIGAENSALDPANVGVDPTDRGAANAVFPPCDLKLAPGLLAHTTVAGASALVTQEPWCSIAGLPGTVSFPPPCLGPPYDDENTSDFTGTEITLPWKFNHYGRNFKHAVMNTNGVLSMGEGSPGANFTNTLVPIAGAQDNLIAPFWDDLEGTPNAQLFYRTDGLPGCRVMTFEWNAFRRFGGTSGNLSMQVKLFEGGAGTLVSSTPPCPYDTVFPGVGNDRIEIHYDHVGFVPAAPTAFSASIGAESWNGTVGNAGVAGTANATPPAGMKCVITTCDTGTVRYYGDANNNAGLDSVTEIKTNTAAPVALNPFALQLVGAQAGSDAYLLLQFGAAAGNIPVPCGGAPLNLGVLGIVTLWVDITSPGFIVIGPLPTSNGGCAQLYAFIPPGLGGFTVYAQWVAIETPIQPNSVVELTEGMRIVLG